MKTADRGTIHELRVQTPRARLERLAFGLASKAMDLRMQAESLEARAAGFRQAAQETTHSAP